MGASGSGAGGEMNSAITWAGTMTSSGARWSRPCCIAQRVAACKTTTEPAMATLRPRPPGGPKRSDWDIETEGAVSVWEPGAVARKTEYQLRRIHQVHVTTRIRLPTSAERRTMLCSPECCWQAGRSGPRPRCGWPPRAGWRSIAPPHPGRSSRSGRTAWRYPIRIGSRQSSCPHERGVRSHGRKPGGIHRRSWLQAVVAGY